MNQKRMNPKTRCSFIAPFGESIEIYFKWGGDGNIFFADRYDGKISAFPVFEDGRISRYPELCGMPEMGENIGVVDPESIGIKQIEWADD